MQVLQIVMCRRGMFFIPPTSALAQAARASAEKRISSLKVRKEWPLQVFGLTAADLITDAKWQIENPLGVVKYDFLLTPCIMLPFKKLRKWDILELGKLMPWLPDREKIAWREGHKGAGDWLLPVMLVPKSWFRHSSGKKAPLGLQATGEAQMELEVAWRVLGVRHAIIYDAPVQELQGDVPWAARAASSLPHLQESALKQRPRSDLFAAMFLRDVEEPEPAPHLNKPPRGRLWIEAADNTEAEEVKVAGKGDAAALPADPACEKVKGPRKRPRKRGPAPSLAVN
jgi:hypothetical protein